jgi:hypothetical protein
MPIIPILVACLIAGVVWWGANKILAAFGIGDPIATVVQVVLVILIVVYLLGAFAPGWHLGRLG